MLAQLQEALNRKLLRRAKMQKCLFSEEMSARYETTKNTLVEAMDRMLTDYVEKAESEKVQLFLI